MSHTYKIHEVYQETYDGLTLGDTYKGGIVHDGMAGVGDDFLIVTVHEEMKMADAKEVQVKPWYYESKG